MQLLYFPIRGKAEPIRVMCEYCKIPYEDVVPEFPELKSKRGSPECPFGQLPLLVDGEQTIAQSGAIIRHIARKHNLYGDGIHEAAMVDTVLCAVEDVISKYIRLIYAEKMNEDAKATYFKEVIDKDSASATALSLLSNILARNGNSFVVGIRASAADFALYNLISLNSRDAMFPEEMKANFPNLVDFYHRISDNPDVKKYISEKQRDAVNANRLG